MHTLDQGPAHELALVIQNQRQSQEVKGVADSHTSKEPEPVVPHQDIPDDDLEDGFECCF